MPPEVEEPGVVIENHVYKIWLGRDGIVRTKLGAGAAVAFEDACAIVRALVELNGEAKRPLCLDLTCIASMDRKARSYLASDEAGRTMCAGAIVVDSHVSRAIGAFLFGLHIPVVPTLLFRSESAAIEWLKGFL